MDVAKIAREVPWLGKTFGHLLDGFDGNAHMCTQAFGWTLPFGRLDGH